MGARNLRRNLPPLHTELEALIWAMHCLIVQQKTKMEFAIDSTELVDMVKEPTKWPVFAVYLEELERNKQAFPCFSLSYTPRLSNSKADLLARSARRQPYDFLYVNFVPSVWVSKPI